MGTGRLPWSRLDSSRDCGSTKSISPLPSFPTPAPYMTLCSDMTMGVLRLSQSDCLRPRLNCGFNWPEFWEWLVPPSSTAKGGNWQISLVHQPTPPSSSPAVGESSFVTCHVSKLTIPLFRVPLPLLQLVSPRL